MANDNNSTPVLACHELVKHYGGVRAVDGTSFDVYPGHITGLIGPNGAGKSTVMSIIAGSEKPDSGTVQFLGDSITGLPSHQIARRGMIRTFQLSSEFPKLTVLENMMVAPRLQSGERLWPALFAKKRWHEEERAFFNQAWELLYRFELDHVADEYAGNLSGGQKRLLELARALMASPRFLMLDEPMSGVNPSLADDLCERLKELHEAGLPILMVEHDLGIIERLCDRVIVMAEGKVLSEGTLQSLREDERVVEAYLS